MSCDDATERLGPTTGGYLPKRPSEEVAVQIAQDFEAFSDLRQAQDREETEDLRVLTTGTRLAACTPATQRP